MMINIQNIIRHNVEVMELLLSLEPPFTSRHIDLTSGQLKRFANSGIITRLGYRNSIIQYELSNHQRKIINAVLIKL
ncbi:hypothetical protein GQ473_04200 [archaeon]|nr:hypothetical protein [archaeon]